MWRRSPDGVQDGWSRGSLAAGDVHRATGDNWFTDTGPSCLESIFYHSSRLIERKDNAATTVNCTAAHIDSPASYREAANLATYPTGPILRSSPSINSVYRPEVITYEHHSPRYCCRRLPCQSYRC